MNIGAGSHPGYRRRPTWIPLIAAFFLLAPFGNFLLTLASLHIRDWYLPSVWAYWVRYVPVSSWIMMSFIFLSGLSLLVFVRTWALILTLFTVGVIAIYNIVMIRTFQLFGTFAIGAMILTTIGALYFLYFTRFRTPYTDPKIRWWETSPRYRVDIEVKIDGVEKSATLSDISLSGALVEWSVGQEMPSSDRVLKIVFPPDLAVDCSVVRATERGYGVKFIHTPKSPTKEKLNSWLRQLRKDPSKIFWG